MTTMPLSLFVAVLLIAAAPAYAQPSDAQREEIRRHLAIAREESANGRHDAAAQSYRQALALMEATGVERAPIARYNIGFELALIPGRELDAQEMFRQFLVSSEHLAGDPEVANFRREAQTRIAQLDGRRTGRATPAVDGAQPTGLSISPVGPIILSVGVLTIAIGGVFGALALTRESELVDRCGGTRCPNIPENIGAYDEMRTFGTAADVLFLVGGLVGAGGLALTLLLQGDRDPQTQQASLRFGPLGLSAESRF